MSNIILININQQGDFQLRLWNMFPIEILWVAPGPGKSLGTHVSLVQSQNTSATTREANYRMCYSGKINSKFQLEMPRLCSQLQ